MERALLIIAIVKFCSVCNKNINNALSRKLPIVINALAGHITITQMRM